MFHKETLELELEKEEAEKKSPALERADSDELNLAEEIDERESLIEERVQKQSSESNLSNEVVVNLEQAEAKRL